MISIRLSLSGCCKLDKKNVFNYFNIFSRNQVKYSTNNTMNVDSDKSLPGRQNVFYFEPSIYLENVNKNDKFYSILYDKIPVILLFGWAGARDSHLKKYQSIYKNLGYHTIRFSPSDKLTFIQTSKQKPYAYELLDLMKDKVSKNQMLIHMFSNAGLFILYQHILNEINDNRNEKYNFFRKNHKGFIIDSAIGSLVAPHKLLSGVAGLLQSQIKFSPLRYLIAAYLVVYWQVYDYLYKDSHYFAKAFNTALHDNITVPTLNFYSTEDKLISPEKIAKFFETRKKLYPDMHLKTVVYNDAEHVLLYAKHPEDYLKHILDHLNYCRLDMKIALGDDYQLLSQLKQNIKSKM
jgi:hypothetical protein